MKKTISLAALTLCVGCVGIVEVGRGGDEGASEDERPVASVDKETQTLPGDIDLSVGRIAKVGTPAVLLRCAIPGTFGYPALLETGAPMPALAGDAAGAVCFAAADPRVGDRFCHWLTTFEQRTRAISACQRIAVEELAHYGAEVLGSERAWRAYANAKLPPIWRAAPSAVGERDGRLARALVNAIGGPRATQIAAKPLCLARDAITAERTTRIDRAQHVRDRLRVLWSDAQQRNAAVLAALREGIEVTARDGATAFAIEIEIDHRQPIPPGASCRISADAPEPLFTP